MGSFSYHVGQRIKKYRKSRGYTIEQFSAMINKSKATLSKYENGTITIDIETLYDIAQALNIDLKCFIDYQPPVFHQEQVLAERPAAGGTGGEEKGTEPGGSRNGHGNCHSLHVPQLYLSGGYPRLRHYRLRIY